MTTDRHGNGKKMKGKNLTRHTNPKKTPKNTTKKNTNWCKIRFCARRNWIVPVVFLGATFFLHCTCCLFPSRSHIIVLFVCRFRSLCLFVSSRTEKQKQKTWWNLHFAYMWKIRNLISKFHICLRLRWLSALRLLPRQSDFIHQQVFFYFHWIDFVPIECILHCTHAFHQLIPWEEIDPSGFYL